MGQYPNEVKFYVKNLPLNIHRYSKQAAIAALAADRQGKYWEFHNKLFENYRSLNDEKILEIAKGLGLDMDAFEKDIRSASINNLVNRDMMEGRKIGVRSTPSVFINGKLLQRRNLKNFQLRIDAELKKSPDG
jgi:protein-disulfide isomerase